MQSKSIVSIEVRDPEGGPGLTKAPSLERQRATLVYLLARGRTHEFEIHIRLSGSRGRYFNSVTAALSRHSSQRRRSHLRLRSRNATKDLWDVRSNGLRTRGRS